MAVRARERLPGISSREARERRHAGDRERRTKNVANVIGMYFRSPPMCRMSCSWCSAWITLPAEEQAGLEGVREQVEDSGQYAPVPIATNMKPSCETVEYASTFLMSYCATPIVAAKNALVQTPIVATTCSVAGDIANAGS